MRVRVNVSDGELCIQQAMKTRLITRAHTHRLPPSSDMQGLPTRSCFIVKRLRFDPSATTTALWSLLVSFDRHRRAVCVPSVLACLPVLAIDTDEIMADVGLSLGSCW